MPAPRLTAIHRHRWWRAMAYASPAIPFAMLAAPALSIVPPIYAKHGALGLAGMSLALVVTRAFDALVDPLIGSLSDCTRHLRCGRAGWIHGSILLAVVAAYFWLDVGADAGFGYFLGWSVCLCLAWSIFEIPHRAMIADTAFDAGERTRMAAWRTAAGHLGMLGCMLVLHVAGMRAGLGPDALHRLGWVVIPLLLVTGVLFQAGLRSRPAPAPVPPPAAAGTVVATRSSLALRSVPMRRLLEAMALQGLATGMTSALYFFYMDTVLGIAGFIPAIALAAGGTGLLASWAWVPAIARLGNTRSIAAGNIVIASVLVLFCLIPPGDYSVAAVMGLFVLSALCVAGMDIAVLSETARIAQYDHYAAGGNHAALFYSYERFTTQISIAIGAGAALLCVRAGGFDPGTGRHASGTLVFLLGFALIPAVLRVAAAWRIRQLKLPPIADHATAAEAPLAP